MGIAVFAAQLIQFSSQWSLLVVQFTAGLLSIFGLCRAFRLKAFLDSWQTLRDKLKLGGFKVSRVEGLK